MYVTDTQLAASDGSSLVGHIANSLDGVARTVQEKLREAPVTPEDFGATGDGLTNDHEALAAMAAAVQAAGGGQIRFTAGRTYVFGQQTPGGGGFYLRGDSPLSFTEVPVVIDLNGATLKLDDGFKFGSFNPSTGSPLGSISTSISEAAHLGSAIQGQECPVFIVTNGTIDLNSQAQIIGGEWGDTGRQLPCYGVNASDCRNPLFYNVSVADSCLDGFALGGGASDPSHSHSIIDCAADKCARNCMTVTGGTSITLEGCRFTNAGEADNVGLGAAFGTSPKSCCDVEDEADGIRDFAAYRCSFIAGSGSNTCFVADSGDTDGVLLDGCTLDGPIWTSKPNTVFRNCTIRGVFAKLAGGQNTPKANTQIIGCTIIDEATNKDLSAYGGLVVSSGSGAGCIVSRNTITLSSKGIQAGGYEFNENEVYCRWDTVDYPSGGALLSFGNGAAILGTTFYEEVQGSPPSSKFFVSLDGSETIDAEIVPSSGNHLFWKTYSAGGGGQSGKFTQGATRASQLHLTFRNDNGAFPDAYGGGPLIIETGIAPPASGTWGQGDLRLNKSASANGIFGWVCTVAGSPGTWVAVRAVQQQTALADASGGTVVDSEARAQLNSLLGRLRTAGILAS